MIVAGILCGALTLYIMINYTINLWTFRKFRGPFVIPLLGNCTNSSVLFGFMGYLATTRKIYGRIFTFFAFTKPMLVVCDPVVVRRVLSDTNTFTKGKDYTKIFSLVFGQGLVTSVGERHKKDRAIFGKYFIRSAVSKFTANINYITSRTIDVVLTNKVGKVFNIEEFFTILAFRTFMQFSCSCDLSDRPALESELAHSVSPLSNIIGQMIVSNLDPWFVPHMVRQVKTGRKVFEDTNDDVVENRRLAMKNGEERKDDCLQAMIDANMSKVEIDEHLVTMLMAGHDTSAYFSSYMCYLLAQNPDAQNRVCAEIKEKIGDRDEITADDCVEMKFLTKVMQETMRLYAIIPMLTRLVTEDVEVNCKDNEKRITLIKGTNVLIPMFLINRDPDLWDNPSSFNPDRFDDQELNFTSAKNGFFPFGYGSRTCIGNTLAQIESAIFIIKLLRVYRIDPDPKFRPKIRSGISLTTSNGINVVLNPRTPVDAI